MKAAGKQELLQIAFNYSSDIDVNPVKGGWPKRSPTSFIPVTSTNLGISLQNFLTFSFNPFVTLA